MNKEIKGSIKSFLIELLVYGALVSGYFFLVLHLMGQWLYRVFEQNRKWYAVTALLLIVCQGLLLEILTRLLLAWIKPRAEAE